MENKNDKEQGFNSQPDTNFILNDDNNESTELNVVKKSKKTIFIIIAAIVVIACVLGVICFKFLTEKFKNGDLSTPAIIENSGILGEEFTFFDNVYINGVSVNGLNLSEALEKVNESSISPSEIKLVIKANNQKFTFTEKDFKYTYNTEEVINNAKTYCDNVRKGSEQKEAKKEFSVSATVTEKSVTSVVNKIAKKVNKNAVNSTFKVNKSGKSFSYTEGSNGYKLNSKDLEKRILLFFNSNKPSATVKAKVKVIKPNLTSNELKENITLLSEFSTYSTNTANGNTNMRVALEKCNGSIIEPGEVWSFNACTGNSCLTSNGFVPATIISGGKYTTGIGGGLCQSSTTIYNAALYANLGIVQRRSHYWASTYCKEGFDASINYNNVDLKLKNNSDYPVYLECYMTGTKLTAKFYGRKDSSFDEIKLSSKRTSYVENSHYDVSATRSLYKNGKLIKSEKLTNSRYSLKPKNNINDSSSKKSTTSVTSSKKNNSSKPVSSKPVSSKPTSSKPTSSKPVSSKPTTETPTVSSTVTTSSDIS